MSESNSKDKIKELEAQVKELTAENEALKLVANASEDDAEVKRESLSEKDRSFSVKVTNDKKTKTVKAILADVTKIYISGQQLTPQEFLKDKDAQATAVACEHPQIKIVE